MLVTAGRIEGFECTRCGHQWFPRRFDAQGRPIEPKQCPNCHSPYWKVPRRTKAQRAELVRKQTRAYWREQRRTR